MARSFKVFALPNFKYYKSSLLTNITVLTQVVVPVSYPV